MSNTQAWGHGRTADLLKEAQGWGVVIPVDNKPQALDPKPGMTGYTIYNLSRETIRVTITFVAGVESNGPARTALVPPLAVLSENFNNDSGINEDQPAIEALSLQVVTLATGEATSLSPPAALAAPVNAVVDFIAA